MTSLNPASRKHDIAFRADGRIDISAHAARMLDLRPGDVIDIAAHASELYLYVRLRAESVVGRHRGTVYATHRSARGTLRAWSRPLAREVLRSAGSRPLLRCPCGELAEINGITCLNIIHHCAL